MICYLLLTENFEKFLAEVFYQFNAKFEASFSFRKVFAWNITILSLPNL